MVLVPEMEELKFDKLDVAGLRVLENGFYQVYVVSGKKQQKFMVEGKLVARALAKKFGKLVAGG